MGLLADIYINRDWSENGTDCTAGGISGPKHKYRGVCIVNIGGPFVPNERYYPVLLVCDDRTKYCKVVPARKRMDSDLKDAWIEDDVHPIHNQHGYLCMGGNFCYTSDSRLSQHINDKIGVYFSGAIPIHDRIETADMLKTYE